LFIQLSQLYQASTTSLTSRIGSAVPLSMHFERRNGLCCIHQKGHMEMDGEQSDSSEDDGKIRAVTADERLRDTHATRQKLLS
jgi:hypothetical protein